MKLNEKLSHSRKIGDVASTIEPMVKELTQITQKAASAADEVQRKSFVAAAKMAEESQKAVERIAEAEKRLESAIERLNRAAKETKASKIVYGVFGALGIVMFLAVLSTTVDIPSKLREQAQNSRNWVNFAADVNHLNQYDRQELNKILGWDKK